MAAGINAFEIFARIGADTKPLETALNRAKGLISGFGKIGGSLFSSFFKINGSAFSAFGKGVVGVFKSIGTKLKNFLNEARSKAMEFEQSMAQVAATMGKSVAEMDSEVETITRKVVRNGEIVMEEFTGNLREYALQLGSETQFTSAQVGEAMNYMALAGYNTIQTMEMLPSVLNLAAAGTMQLGRASDVVTDVQTAFGLNSERTAQMIDEMAKAASTGNTSVSQLGDAFLTVGGLAKNVGHGFAVLADGTKVETDNVQEITTALVAMANAGVKGSEAGMHMRNMLLKLSGPTDDGTLKLEELGVAVFDAQGNMRSLREIFSELSEAMSTRTMEENLQTMKDLFNARDITSAQAILSAIENTSWDKIAGAVLDADGAAEKMAETLRNTASGAKTLFESARDNFMIAVSNATNFGGAQFAQLFRFGADALGALTKALEEGGWEGFLNEVWAQADKVLDNIIMQVPEKITDMLAKLPQLIIAVLPKLMQAATKMLTKLTDAISGKGDSGGIASKLKALPSRIIAMWTGSINQNGPALFEAGKKLLETLLEGAQNVAGTIGERIVPVMTSILSAIFNFEGDIVDAGGTIIDKLIEGITSEESLNAFFDEETGIIPILTTIVEAIGKFAYKLLDAAVKIIDAIGKYLVDDKNKEKLKGQASEFLEKFGWHLGQVVSKLWEGVVAICTYLTEGIVGEFDADETAGSLIWKLVKAILKAAAEIPRILLNPIDWGLEHVYGAANRAEMEEMEKYLKSGSNLTFDAWKEQQAQRAAEDQAAGKIYQTDEAKEAYYKGLLTTPLTDDEKRDWIARKGIQGVPIFGNGGIVDRPTLAVVGDDGREAIVPLDKDSAIGRKFGGVSISFGNIYVQGGKNAGQEVVKQIDEALRIYQIQQGRGIGATGY